MKSILQSALLYVCVTKSRDLDKKTDDILVSFVYIFWMLKFSDHNTSKHLNIADGMAELWCLIFNVFQETKSWSHQHCLVGERLLKIADNESIEAIRRMAMITTVKIDVKEASEQISSFSRHMKHSFGNLLTWQIGTNEDAIMDIAANVSK